MILFPGIGRSLPTYFHSLLVLSSHVLYWSLSSTLHGIYSTLHARLPSVLPLLSRYFPSSPLATVRPSSLLTTCPRPSMPPRLSFLSYLLRIPSTSSPSIFLDPAYSSSVYSIVCFTQVSKVEVLLKQWNPEVRNRKTRYQFHVLFLSSD